MLLTFFALLAIYHQTAISTEEIWQRSETFAHGFLIFPISAYLIWRRRAELSMTLVQPDLRGLVVIAVLGFGWLMADLGNVLVVAQYCLVAMIPAAVWTLLGRRIVATIAFPLAFLLLAVPVGEFLIPPLMNFTADFVVSALQITGIPVFREGTFFTIPSGQWSVVEGCSGLRYLIASFTLGTLYGYLTYRSTRRRILFALAALIVPVIANGMRAYMIVMIAHLSDMKLALGVDHIIYGWVFFGIVMMLLFWVGSFWQEDQPEPSASEVARARAPCAPSRKLLVAAVAIVAVTAIWPGYGSYLDVHRPDVTGLQLPLPTGAGNWQASSTPFTNWEPHFAPADASVNQVYRNGEKQVALYLRHYRFQREGAQLITSTNVMIPQKNPVWGNVGEGSREIQVDGQTLRVRQTLLRSSSQRLLIWQWNLIGSRSTANPYLAKLLFATNRLMGGTDEGTAVIIAAPYQFKPEEAVPTLEQFARDMEMPITASINAIGTDANR